MSEIEPKLIQAGMAADDRGFIQFVNTMPEDVKRFYIVSNHKSHFVRAWHAHKNEGKYVYVISGVAKVCCVKIDDWDVPDRKETAMIHKYILTDNSPLLYIPPGYANGFMNLKENTKIMFMSTSTLEESKNDDYRYEAHYWDTWEVEER